jgi:hypothetical protein
MISIKDQYIAMKKPLRLAFDGPRKVTRKLWSLEMYIATLKPWQESLEKRLKALLENAKKQGIPEVLFHHLIQIVGALPFDCITTVRVLKAIKQLKRSLHDGRMRYEMRIRMPDRVSDLEDKKVAEKIGEIIRALSNEPRKHLVDVM